MWLIYGVIGAAGKGLTNYYRKRVSGSIDTDVYLWLSLTLSIPIVAVLVLLLRVPVHDLVVQKPLHIFTNAFFWLAALVFNMRAFKKEELSYIAPLGAFIPLFSLLFAWLFLHQSPPAIGLTGIAVVFAGAYITNLTPHRVSWYDPIKHLLTNSGARYAMSVSVCFGVVSVVTKSVTNDGFSPVGWLLMINTASWLLLAYVPFRKPKQLKNAMTEHRQLLISVSLATLVAGLFGILSIASTDFTAYAISVRRFDIIFSILLGWKVLGDSNIRNKIIGGSLMTCGVILTASF